MSEVKKEASLASTPRKRGVKCEKNNERKDKLSPSSYLSRLCRLAVKSVSKVSAVDFEALEMRRINQAPFDSRALSHQVTIYFLGFESESDYGTC